MDRLVRTAIRLTFGALALGTLAAGEAAAQQRAPAPAAAAYRGLISFNPLGIPFNIFSGELEGAIAQGFTLAGVASHVDFGSDDARFTSFELKGRYYPNEIALSGLSFGLGLGSLHYSDVVGAMNGVTQRKGHTTPTISVSADYNFLLGAQRRFLVGVGGGAKRILDRGPDEVGVPRAYPTVRFLVGLAF